MDIEKMESLEDLFELENLKRYVYIYYQIQKTRITVGNRIHSYTQGTAEIPDGVEYLISLKEFTEQIEKELEKRITQIVRDHPFYSEYLRYVKGIGPMLGASIIAHGPYSRFATVSKLWKYMGVAPGQGPFNQDKKYNRKMKVTFYKAGFNFVKLGDRSPYGSLYKEFREEYEKKWPDKSKLNKHLAALRKVVKLFASHVWAVWWEIMEGKEPPTMPYPFVHQTGHRDYYDPWEFTEKVKKWRTKYVT